MYTWCVLYRIDYRNSKRTECTCVYAVPLVFINTFIHAIGIMHADSAMRRCGVCGMYNTKA